MRAFILGNSGELLDHDLSLLEGEAVFGVNALPLRCPEIITHYVLLDIAMAFHPEIRALVRPDCIKYYSRIVWNTIYHEDNVRVFDCFPDKHTGFNISDTMVYPCGMVTYPALQIAAALGFNPIYTLGIDIGTPANGIYHIPEEVRMSEIMKAKNLANPTVDKRSPLQPFEAAKKTFQRHFAYAASVLRTEGIEVINLSRGGNLNCFKRESYESLFNHAGRDETKRTDIKKEAGRPALEPFSISPACNQSEEAHVF